MYLSPRSCSLLTQLLDHTGQVASLGRLTPQECLGVGTGSAALLSNRANRAAAKSLSFGPSEGVGQLGGPGRPSAPPQSPSLGVSNRTGANENMTHDP